MFDNRMKEVKLVYFVLKELKGEDFLESGIFIFDFGRSINVVCYIFMFCLKENV